MGFAISKMQLTSTAFQQDGRIPAKHTGEGEDVSPALAWRDAPEGSGWAKIMDARFLWRAPSGSGTFIAAVIGRTSRRG